MIEAADIFFELGDDVLLTSLDPDQIRYVARGLEQTFECTLSSRDGRLWIVDLDEGGTVLLLKPQATIKTIWRTAEILEHTRRS